MIEQLSNLKNNKTKAVTGVASEAELSLRKYISGLAKKSGHESEPLRMSLADLRAADSKGKWWLVGAAWSGNPLVDQKEDFQGIGQGKDASSDGKEALLLKLARKQGMNTETRRQIFVAVTGAEDYIDAAERVSQLGLKEVQQREIVRVLLHCLSNVSFLVCTTGMSKSTC
jgi:nucleolar MIF4G domain-containing protein 1